MRAREQRWHRRRASPEELDMAELPARAWRVFDLVDAKIEHADAKAGVILGACGVTAAAILGLVTNRNGQNIILTVTAIASGIFVITAAAFACGALWPRRLKKYPAASHLYFDHINRRSAESAPELEKELRALLTDHDSLVEEIISQVTATSRVASQKYDFLDRAMFCLFGGLFGLAASATTFAIYYRGR